jgi:hypothetical protein
MHIQIWKSESRGGQATSLDCLVVFWMKPLTVTGFGVERHSLVCRGDHPDLLLHFRVGSQSHPELAYVSNALLSCSAEDLRVFITGVGRICLTSLTYSDSFQQRSVGGRALPLRQFLTYSDGKNHQSDPLQQQFRRT